MPTRLDTLVSSRLSFMPTLLGAAAALGILCASAAHAQPTGLLNDTGQTLCDGGGVYMVYCTAGNTGDAGTYKRQDGRFGRDPAAPVKVGGGAAGFDFTRVCFNGDLQGAGTCTGALVANTTGTVTGPASTDWACTKDNVTNLIWSLQSQYSTWNDASAGTYPDAGHNTPSRCGFATGWRLPTRRELLNIVVNDRSNPSIDADYFPSTETSRYYLTSDLIGTTTVWTVGFVYGATYHVLKTSSHFVRLVRSGL